MYGGIHDVILFYTQGRRVDLERASTRRTTDLRTSTRSTAHVEPETGRRYPARQHRPGSRRGYEAKGNPPYEVLGVTRHWRTRSGWTLDRTAGSFQTSPAASRSQALPGRDEGVPLEDLWTDIGPVNCQALERIGYDTQKPRRSSSASSRRPSNAGRPRGGLLLRLGHDCWSSAERLGRRWIGCDLGRFAIHTTRKRLLEHPGLPAVRHQEPRRLRASALAGRDRQRRASRVPRHDPRLLPRRARRGLRPPPRPQGRTAWSTSAPPTRR